MSRCGDTLIGEANGHGVAATQRCGCWHCADCWHDNCAKLARLICQFGPTLFVTLTCNPHWFGSPDERAQRLSHSWSLIRRRLRRRYPHARFDFVAIFEANERGEPHLHIPLRDCPLKATELNRLLRMWMRELMSAGITDVRTVDDVPGLARYLSKGPHIFSGCRRYWTSKGWRARFANGAFALIDIVRASVTTVEKWARAAGHTILAYSPRRLETLKPFSPP